MNTLLNVRSKPFALVAAAVAAFALAGCGGAAPETKQTFNDADVAFASGMIPHHQQAVVMSDWAATQAADPKVKALAKRITDAQGPEITKMTNWLKAWDQPVPAAYDPDSEHGAHSMGDMGGMMSAEDMKTLEQARGKAFDAEFLTQMISHHKGAVTMAREEQKTGLNPEAKELAKTIVKDQMAELDEMWDLL